MRRVAIGKRETEAMVLWMISTAMMAAIRFRTDEMLLVRRQFDLLQLVQI